jgi:hypothetical protein
VVAVRDWKLAPSEFWEMPLEEWFWLYNATLPPESKRMSAEDFNDCLAVLEGVW